MTMAVRVTRMRLMLRMDIPGRTVCRMMKAMTPHTSQTSTENIVISIMDMADGAEKRLKRRADENSKVTMDIYAMFGYNSIKELSDDVNSALIPQGDSEES